MWKWSKVTYKVVLSGTKSIFNYAAGSWLHFHIYARGSLFKKSFISNIQLLKSCQIMLCVSFWQIFSFVAA